jgi:hypothetical protein
MKFFINRTKNKTFDTFVIHVTQISNIYVLKKQFSKTYFKNKNLFYFYILVN